MYISVFVFFSLPDQYLSPPILQLLVTTTTSPPGILSAAGTAGAVACVATTAEMTRGVAARVAVRVPLLTMRRRRPSLKVRRELLLFLLSL